MKRIICLIMALVLAISLCACGGGLSDGENLTKGFKRSESIAEYNFVSGEDIMPEDYEQYISGATDFAVKLLAESAQEGENLVVSPVSVSEALSVLANGAADKTRTELRNVLASGASIDLINICSHYLNSRLTAFNSEDGYFRTANSLWFNDTFDVKSAFLQTSVNYYDTGLFRIPFAEEDAVEKINGWVSENTDGEIENVLDTIDENAKALIVNAVVLSDAWTTPYKDTQVSEGVFHGAKGDAQTEFMTSVEYYISSSYAQGFVKGFENIPCKFAAILPNEDTDITEFVNNLTGNRLTALLESQAPMETCVASLPEFSISSDLDLADSLQAVGINRAFDYATADFSSLSNTGQVYINKITQDAFIEVGPQGAKAGAATVVELTDSLAATEETPEKELVFDRPFVFVIYDNESNIPVFMGVVNNIG